MKQLKSVQSSVLNLLAERGGRWKAGCGWEWGSAHRTENVLSSLAPRGLVAKVGEHQGYGIFEITPQGAAVAKVRVSA